MRAPPETGDGPPAILAFARPGAAGPGVTARLRALARHPGEGAEILRARLSGRPLRARQRLAALVGIDHALALPAGILARLPTVPTPAAPPGIRLFGAPGHALVAGAPERIAAAFADPDLQALYSDALVQVVPGGPVLPLLRPVFDPRLAAATGYVGPVVAVRDGALPANGAATALDALFHVHERFGAAAIGHLPEILAVWRPWTAPEAGLATERRARLAAVRAHLDRAGEAGTDARLDAAGLVIVRPPLPLPRPVASLIVPTRDRLDLLRPCVESLLRTDWPALEILILDNGSREAETLDYLRDLEARGLARTLPCPGPFDFAAMNNAGAAAARGTLLAFVNNDVETIAPDWLARMAAHALRPEVGAVGAKLLDGAGRIQHAGIVLGTGGLVTHGHRHFPGDAPGYLCALRAAHRVSAVTAACLVVARDKFMAVGGFDAAHFAVDFNDVDLCLRLARAGWHSVLEPAAILHHREGASRRRSPEAQARHEGEVAALRRRWGPLLAQDPHYHPGFDPGLSTHARLRAGFPFPGPQAVRRPPG